IYQDAVVETLRREMPVIMYHRFIEQDSEKGVHGTWMPITMFEKHLRLMKWLGYETLTFRDLADKGFIHRLQYGKKYLMITADDGYQDNLTRMLPLLEKYGYKAVVYVVTGEGYNRWDVEHPTNPDTKVSLMSGEQVKALAASGHVEIGGHTLTHPRLSKLTPEQQAHEIQENKRQLEALLGHPLLSFAYPYGDMNESAKEQAITAGYRFAVATNSGPKAMHQDPFQIRRIAIFPRTDVFGLWRKIRGNYVFRK
ncbi:MAG: polysaccharide deacetylase family protein, partial [Aeromonas veronii]